MFDSDARSRLSADRVRDTPSSREDPPRQTVHGRGRNAHDGQSGFRIISDGVDGFLIRVQMIDAAERTLDLQYFIFRGDQTGRLLTDALVRAAARGVRVRVLVDDGDTVAGDEQILALDGRPI